MKRNFIHNVSTGKFRSLFVYCVRPLLILSFLFCQLSFQTEVANHVHYEQVPQEDEIIQPANIVIPGSAPPERPGKGLIESVMHHGKNTEYPTPAKIKTVGKRSVEIYRIML